MNARAKILGGVAFAALMLAGQALAGPVDEMMAADKAFARMSVAQGAHAAFLAYMSDDVRLYDSDHPPIIGKAAVAEYYARNPDSPGEKLDWTPIEGEASPDGVLGYTRGTWIYTAKKADGSDVKVTGYYVTEWRRGSDGQYKFVLDIGGADKPAKTQ